MNACKDIGKKESNARAPVRPHSQQDEDLHREVEAGNLVEQRALRGSRPVVAHAPAPVLDIRADVAHQCRRAIHAAYALQHARPVTG